MTCEVVQEELVAYCDGELPEQEREQVAAHLKTCAACAREEAQLARMERLLATVERIAPSPDFAANFWKRVEQERIPVTAKVGAPPLRVSRFARWWKDFHETLNAWQVAPALAAAASVLVFFGYFFYSTLTSQKSTTQKPTTVVTAPEAPAGLVEKPGLFVNYNIIAELERFSRFEEIAAVQLPEEHATEVAKDEEVPPEVLQNPSFFAHYPMLKKMEQLKSLEAILDRPAENDKKNQG
jgi:negative regulator of sigma E activity